MQADHFHCPVCGQKRRPEDRRSGRILPQLITQGLRRRAPGWEPDRPVCRYCVAESKAEYLESMLMESGSPASVPDQSVLDSVRRDGLMTASLEQESPVDRLTWQQKLSQRTAALAGSWRLPFLILLFLVTWIGLNLIYRPFAPFPVIVFAVISAVLASLAALQAPLILDSQRLQQEMDRQRSQTDYRLNLTAELEIRYLDQKTDLILQRQEELLEELRELRSALGREESSPG